MGSVAQLSDYQPNSHSTGEAKCTACGYEYVCVSPVGIAFFTCPECRLEKARFKFPFGGQEGDVVFCCLNCGEEYFYFINDGIRCGGCGSWIEFDDVFGG